MKYLNKPPVMGTVYKENVGEIVMQNDEFFWIFPKSYIFSSEPLYIIHSPWFSFIGEKWRFVIPTIDCNYSNFQFYIWRKFLRDLTDRKYTIQLKIKTKDGSVYCYREGGLNCDYGFTTSFISRQTISQCELSQDGLLKIFFFIKENALEADPLCSAIENSNENDKSREKESFSEDEESNDEDDDEKRNILSKDRGIKILLNDLKQVFSDERMTDAVMKVDGREFKVHKVILIARSPVFASMFEHDMVEKKDNIVDIPDCTAESFEVFLYYLYSGSVATLSISNVHDVYYAADKYRVDDLKKRCLKLMIDNISVESFCDVISLALRHGESKLQKRATDFFSQNIKKIIKTVQWQKYMVESATHANELLIKALNA